MEGGVPACGPRPHERCGTTQDPSDLRAGPLFAVVTGVLTPAPVLLPPLSLADRFWAYAVGAPEEAEDAPEPLIKEADPEFERLLAEEEEIERTTREHHETPHFRPGDGD